MSLRVLRFSLSGVVFLLFWLLIWIVGIYGNPFPYTDEWYIIPYAISGIDERAISWLLDWHVDHRIPLAKLYNVLLLRLSDFDFRIIQLTNAALLFVTSLFILYSLISGKGQVDLGDFAIPLILLSAGFNPAFWGFGFQFMSSTLLLLGFSFALLRTNYSSSAVWMIFGSLCLFAMVFCGMNGVIPAMVISFAMLVGLRWMEPKLGKATGRLVSFLLIMTLMAGVLNFIGWQPSRAATIDIAAIGSTIGEIAGKVVMLLKPTQTVIPPEISGFYLALNLLLLIVACMMLGYHLVTSYHQIGSIRAADFAMLMSIFGVMALLVSIAIGRSGYWVPGLEKHYGFLSVVLPIVAWAAISIHMRQRLFVWGVGILFVSVHFYLYVVNLDWRTTHERKRKSEMLTIYGEMVSGYGVNEIVARHIDRFFFIDNSHYRQFVGDRMRLLRAHKVDPYKRLSED